MNDQMDKIFIHSNDNEITINSLANHFTDTINKAATSLISFKKLKKNSNKVGTNSIPKQNWFDNNCYRLKKELRNLGKLLSKQPNNPFVRHLFFTKKKEYKKLTRKLKRNFYSNILDKIKILADSNPKAFWNLVNSIKSNRTSGSNEISPVEWFNYFHDLNKTNFSSESTSTESRIVADINLWATSGVEILDKPISLKEIHDISRKLKPNKASANDSLNNEIINLIMKLLKYHPL
ncbi:Hypothetical predicted protein, partial [Paramuricea clavata]